MTVVDDLTLRLSQLCDAAEVRGMWLVSRYHGLWFAPEELRTANRDGQFRWGVANWELRPPSDLIAEHETKVRNAERELAAVRVRVDRAERLRGQR